MPAAAKSRLFQLSIKNPRSSATWSMLTISSPGNWVWVTLVFIDGLDDGFIMDLMFSVFLALGSNLGEREHYLQKAVESLPTHDIEIAGAAGVYETEPKDVTDQPWFLNTVVHARTALSPRELLQAALSIELENQRVRTASKSARTLDVDIIFYENQVICEPGLTIPHPRFRERKFVLI